jgi:hypothetical protein
MTPQELKNYVIGLRERFFREKKDWRGEHIAWENAYLKGMERAVELLEKGLRPSYPPPVDYIEPANAEHAPYLDEIGRS